jgi:hypothetical protein
MSGDLNGDGEFDFKLLLDHANRGGGKGCYVAL